MKVVMATRRMTICSGAAVMGLVAALVMGADKTPGRAVDFERDVRPIFAKACVSCHGGEKQKSDYRLDDRRSALTGGSIGGGIVPGDSKKSLLIAYVSGEHDDIRMPP